MGQLEVVLAEDARAAKRLANDAEARVGIARFFAEHIAVAASGLERAVVEGAGSINTAEAALSS